MKGPLSNSHLENPAIHKEREWYRRLAEQMMKSAATDLTSDATVRLESCTSFYLPIISGTKQQTLDILLIKNTLLDLDDLLRLRLDQLFSHGVTDSGTCLHSRGLLWCANSLRRAQEKRKMRKPEVHIAKSCDTRKID